MTLKEEAFERGDPFIKPWYSTERKFLKLKLGRLYKCKLKNSDTEVLCRVINYDRISYYQVEAFYSDLARLSLYKMSQFIVMPLGVHVSKKMEISVIVPEMISLHEIIF